MHPVIQHWKGSLARLLALYDRQRRPFSRFFVRLFFFFVVVNLACYGLAMFTAFPELTRGPAGVHYFKVGLPVSVLGAVFDSLSFFLTVFIVRHALRATSALSYVSHLSVDLLIAIVATWWVLFVFALSGWIVSQLGAEPQLLTDRRELYEDRALAALRNPIQSARNIYFGLVMGMSAMIPTTLHLGLSLKALIQVRGSALPPGSEAALD